MSVQLSIGTAVYNLEESFLRAHIDGLRGQLTDETELLLIDDCSTNNSGEVCKEYADADSRIRYIRMEENEGNVTWLLPYYVICCDADSMVTQIKYSDGPHYDRWLRLAE